MILPGSQALALAVLILGMLCWGLWPNTIKLAGKWRFELFYIDFAVGVGVAATIVAITFGSMGWDGFSLLDDLRLAGKRHDLFAFLAGCIFNLGNMLLVGAISIAGISFAVPVAMGMALIVGSALAFSSHAESSILMMVLGCVMVLAAIVCAAISYKDVSRTKLAVTPEPGKKATRKTFSYKGVVIAVVGGLMIGSFYPLLQMANTGEDGLGPYSSAFIFAVGLFLSTVIFSLFFMNLPIQGRPVEMSAYFSGRAGQHTVGFLGGVLWLCGIVAVLVASRLETRVKPQPLAQFLLPNIAPLIAILFGIIVWKELAGSASRGRTFFALMLLLYVAGLAVLSAPYYGAH